MSTARIADHRHDPATRERRARGIVADHAREIAESAQGAIYKVPGGVGVYVVSLSRQVCECADFSHRGAPCKHLLAAEIVSAKSAVCADCARRYLGRDLYEVTEDHESLTWFPGDRLCGPCAMAHGIV